MRILSAPAALLLLCAPALSAATAPSATLPAPGALRPNIVLILADDLGYGELGSYGQELIRTPHLDRLAREGLRFTRFYAGSPVCAPSRSVLLTGLHTGHTRVRGNAGRDDLRRQELRPGDLTVAEVLHRAGYATAAVGKWGLGHEGSPAVPTRMGFDHFYGYLSQTHAHNYYPEFLIRGEERAPLRNRLARRGKPYEEQGAGWAEVKADYAPDLMAEEALRWIEKHREKPFFLYWPVIEPHANNEAQAALGNGQEVPDLGEYAGKPWKEAEKAHAATITRMDAAVGRLLDLLKRLGLEEKTLVIFTSDNGPHREGGYPPGRFRESGPLRGMKRDLYEGGIRVPAIAHWPGVVPAGSTCDRPAYFGDFLATAAELAGAEAPPGVDSVSFVPSLRGRPPAERRRFLYWEFHERGFSQAVLLDGRWKAVRNRRPDLPLELYDLDQDPGETRDVAAEHPRVVAEIRQYLETARSDSDDWPIRPAKLKRL